MTEIVRYKAAHMVSIIGESRRQEEDWFITADIIAPAKAKEQGDAWTLLDNARPLACGGFYRFEGNEAEAWFLLCPDAKKYAKTITRFIRWAFDYATEVKGVRRFVAHVLDYDTTGQKWATLFGFRDTGVRTVDMGHDYMEFRKVAG